MTFIKKRRDAFFKSNGLVIMDSMWAHLCENVKAACKSARAHLSIIPGGLTKILQPLDVGVNKSFKNKMRNLWEEFMSSLEDGAINAIIEPE